MRHAFPMMPPFVLHELSIANPREQTPFGPSPSYNDGWWTRPDAPDGVNMRYFELREGTTDLTRIRVFDPSNIRVQLDGFDLTFDTIEVDRIETRVERQREGFAVTALILLRERFDSFQIAAFSHKDEFWRKTDFEPRRRVDGNTGAATVFVAPPLSASQGSRHDAQP